MSESASADSWCDEWRGAKEVARFGKGRHPFPVTGTPYRLPAVQIPSFAESKFVLI